ncbi:hypothetical protein OUZ56_004446 [Daphnia magna]|uniref:Uncharacterized protein n=1 Tax=Daphnia magna TaxID=35525 RepID=A0ABQ9YPZ8_9CRUS|nr:hypothetical protein OUZ56_004446 [Daphnia magna]
MANGGRSEKSPFLCFAACLEFRSPEKRRELHGTQEPPLCDCRSAVESTSSPSFTTEMPAYKHTKK